MLTRRDFLASSLALGAYPLVGRAQNASSNPVFRHGVASGDPLTDRVILWTRVTPATRATGSIEVEWSVARNPDMSRVVGRGSTLTSRRARLHGQDRRQRARTRGDLLLPLCRARRRVTDWSHPHDRDGRASIARDSR